MQKPPIHLHGINISVLTRPMLVDIFARRYQEVPLRAVIEQRDIRLLTQAFRILAEDICPYYQGGKEDAQAVQFWTDLHSRLSRELGLKELSPLWFSYTRKWNGVDHIQTHKHSLVQVCENWLMQPAAGSVDEYVKERLSLIELGFREGEKKIAAMNAAESTSVDALMNSLRISGNPAGAGLTWRQQKTAAFQAAVDELNTRFRQADYPLHYHNGFIQFSTDGLVQKEVEDPFWFVVSTPDWKNVDTDMKEALDLRDSDGRDPAFYAARALESTIKIISDKNCWTTGNERGASNFIDNLAAKKNAFIAPWEGQSLKSFFSDVRNPLGHGAGSAEMPSLTRSQTEWAIEYCMIWVKALVRRL